MMDGRMGVRENTGVVLYSPRAPIHVHVQHYTPGLSHPPKRHDSHAVSHSQDKSLHESPHIHSSIHQHSLLITYHSHLLHPQICPTRSTHACVSVHPTQNTTLRGYIYIYVYTVPAHPVKNAPILEEKEREGRGKRR